MLTAFNGILIVVLVFWLGLEKGDDFLVYGALLLAGLSYVLNVGRETELIADEIGRDTIVARGLFWGTAAAGAFLVLYALNKYAGVI